MRLVSGDEKRLVWFSSNLKYISRINCYVYSEIVYLCTVIRGVKGLNFNWVSIDFKNSLKCKVILIIL